MITDTYFSAVGSSVRPSAHLTGSTGSIFPSSEELQGQNHWSPPRNTIPVDEQDSVDELLASSSTSAESLISQPSTSQQYHSQQMFFGYNPGRSNRHQVSGAAGVSSGNGTLPTQRSTASVPTRRIYETTIHTPLAHVFQYPKFKDPPGFKKPSKKSENSLIQFYYAGTYCNSLTIIRRKAL
jgi:hypothetical protein